MNDANPITVRNIRNAQRSSGQSLFGLAVLVVLGFAFLVCGFRMRFDKELVLIVVVPVAMLCGLGGWWLLVNFSPWALGLEKLVLEEGLLHRVPGRTYPTTQLQRIALLPDPDEDYVELDRPVRVYLARISPRLGASFAILISNGDAERLRLWALANKLAVDDQREQRDG